MRTPLNDNDTVDLATYLVLLAVSFLHDDWTPVVRDLLRHVVLRSGVRLVPLCYPSADGLDTFVDDSLDVGIEVGIAKVPVPA